ncbi:MAG: AI-2E family transporter [Amphiplicatus sp.]
MAEGASARAGGQMRLLTGLGLAVLIGFIAWVGRGVLIPVVVAGFLSFLIFTLKETIKAGPLIGRILPNWLCYLLAFAFIVSLTIFLIEIIRDNVEALIAAAPSYEARLRDLTAGGVAWLERLGVLPEDFVGGVDELRRTALGMINPLLSQVGSSVRALTANSLTIFLYTVFMLLERGRIFRKIEKISGDRAQRQAVNETIADIAAMVRQYITVKTVINLITASGSYVILRLLGVDFPGFWALLIFVLNYIPIVGPIVANAFPVILALVQPEGGLRLALVTLALLVGLEQTMSTLVEPRLVGRSLNLSPLMVLFSLAVWGSLWGFAGALLAVPITVTLMIILTQFRSTRPIAILMSESGRIAEIRHAPLAAAPSGPSRAATE